MGAHAEWSPSQPESLPVTKSQSETEKNGKHLIFSNSKAETRIK